MSKHYSPDIHHRRSIRLKGYDYTQAGTYFVTICVQHRMCLLGEICDKIMRHNAAGQMIQAVWNELPQHYPGVAIDAFVAMPNHVHGIILLTGIDQVNADQTTAPVLSLPEVVHRFKSLTTAQYRKGVSEGGWKPFPGKLWQRNYYEHIVRDATELNHIRDYIARNPAHWAEDAENPE